MVALQSQDFEHSECQDLKSRKMDEKPSKTRGKEDKIAPLGKHLREQKSTSETGKKEKTQMKVAMDKKHGSEETGSQLKVDPVTPVSRSVSNETGSPPKLEVLPISRSVSDQTHFEYKKLAMDNGKIETGSQPKVDPVTGTRSTGDQTQLERKNREKREWFTKKKTSKGNDQKEASISLEQITASLLGQSYTQQTQRLGSENFPDRQHVRWSDDTEQRDELGLMEYKGRFQRRRSISETNLANLPTDYLNSLANCDPENSEESDDTPDDQISSIPPVNSVNRCNSYSEINADETPARPPPSSQSMSRLNTRNRINSSNSQTSQSQRSSQKAISPGPITRYTMDKYGNIFGPFVFDPSVSPIPTSPIPTSPTSPNNQTMSKFDLEQSKPEKSEGGKKNKTWKKTSKDGKKNPQVDKVKKTTKPGGSLEDVARLNLMLRR